MDLNGIVVIVGAYGSGKTEVSVNLAVESRQAGKEVRIADLDLVNPYFRTREAKDMLSGLGIDLVLPPAQYLHASLPILSPIVSGMIRRPSELTILDAGGDNVGVTVLAALADALKGKEAKMLQVVNPFRPFTDTPEGCMTMRQKIEKTSRLPVAGIIGNANMMEETVPEHVYEGCDFVLALSEKWRLPIEFVTVPARLLPETDMSRFACPVLPVKRQLVPPWLKADSLNGKS